MIHIDISDSNLTIESITSVHLLYLTAERQSGSALLRWEVAYAADHQGFYVYREEQGGTRKHLNTGLLTGFKRYAFEDEMAPVGETCYWLQEIEANCSVNWYGPVIFPPVLAIEQVLSLAPNHPNPFNPTMTARYTLPKAGRVLLSIHDARGHS